LSFACLDQVEAVMSAKFNSLRRNVLARAVLATAFIAFAASSRPAVAQCYPYNPYYYSPYYYPYYGYRPVGVSVGWGVGPPEVGMANRLGLGRRGCGWRGGWGWHH
jgi:hypothetical protein